MQNGSIYYIIQLHLEPFCFRPCWFRFCIWDTWDIWYINQCTL